MRIQVLHTGACKAPAPGRNRSIWYRAFAKPCGLRISCDSGQSSISNGMAVRPACKRLVAIRGYIDPISKYVQWKEFCSQQNTVNVFFKDLVCMDIQVSCWNNPTCISAFVTAMCPAKVSKWSIGDQSKPSHAKMRLHSIAITLVCQVRIDREGFDHHQKIYPKFFNVILSGSWNKIRILLKRERVTNGALISLSPLRTHIRCLFFMLLADLSFPVLVGFRKGMDGAFRAMALKGN